MRASVTSLLLILLAISGCTDARDGSGAEPIVTPDDKPGDRTLPDDNQNGASGIGGSAGFDQPFPGGGSAGIGAGGGFAPPPFRPVDERAVVRSSITPKAIQGGTLAISPDDSRAIVADPDRDRIMVVDLVNGGVLGSIALDQGDEPGRVVFDADSRVHVVLRGSGELLTFDLATRDIIARRAVCSMPQGVAFDAAQGSVHVACTGGELVSLPAEGGDATRTVNVELDLRDVVVRADGLYVSTFKTAELLHLDADGRVSNRKAPIALKGSLISPISGIASADRTMEAAVAWRTLSMPNGSVTMLHQRAQLDAIGLSHDDAAAVDGSGVAGTGAPIDCGCVEGEMCACGGFAPPPGLGFPGEGGDSSYGGGGASCTSIVETGVTQFDGDNGGVQSSPPIMGAVLPVDAAVSPDGAWLAIAAAGAFEDQQLLGNPSASDGLGVIVMPMNVEMPSDTCVAPAFSGDGALVGSGQAVAVAFDSAGALVVQTRDPNRLRVYRTPNCGFGCVSELDISLGGEARRDTGHDLFHLDAGAGLACASCHPGGADDGRVWNFADFGPRRTQLFTMGIEGTEPLHWDGSLAKFSDLVSEVFVNRMGGAPQSAPRLAALESWMNKLTPNPSLRATDDPAAVRGHELFTSDEVGCTSCHTGEKLTNNATVDVGTGGAFQVPSLIGVVYHQPYIHNGCAKTLRDRFDPACGGGDMHGKTSHLTEGEIQDLVAYVETL